MPLFPARPPSSLLKLAPLGLAVVLFSSPASGFHSISVEGTLSGDISWSRPEFGTPGSPSYRPADGGSGSFSEDFSGVPALQQMDMFSQTYSQTWTGEITPHNSHALASFTATHVFIPGSTTVQDHLYLSFDVGAYMVQPYGDAAANGAATIQAQISLEISTPETMTLLGASSSLNSWGMTGDITAQWFSATGSESWTASFQELRSGSIIVNPGLLVLSASVASTNPYGPGSPAQVAFTFQDVVVVPEPGGFLLLGTATMFLLTRRRQKAVAPGTNQEAAL